MKRAKVLLADDHAIVAQGLQSLLEGEFESVGSVGDGRELLEAARQQKPDIIIADISMPLLNGIDALRQLKAEGVPSKVIFLTMHTEARFAAEAFRAGASGYVLKHSAGEELMTAIEEVMQGRTYVTPRIAGELLEMLAQSAEQPAQTEMELTARQREVLQLIAEGKTMKEIASLLQISTRTVESHKYQLMRTLGVQTTAELVQCAIRLGLISL